MEVGEMAQRKLSREQALEAWILQHPMAVRFIPFAIGTALAYYWFISPIILLGTAASCGVAALFMRRARPWVLQILLFILGWMHLSWWITPQGPQDLRLLITGSTEMAEVRGRLLEDSTEALLDGDEEMVRTTARIKAEQIRLGRGDWQPAEGGLLVRLKGALPGTGKLGQWVQIKGVIRPPVSPNMPGVFNYAAVLKLHRIYHILYVDKTADWQVMINHPPSRVDRLAERFLIQAKEIMRYGMPVEDDALRLNWAMMLGWKPGLTEEVSLPFMRSGTMHIFAISGLHVAMIAGILVALLRFLLVPRPVCGLLVIPAIWFYTGATGWQPSAIRSVIMATVVIAGWSLRRPSNLLNSLAASGFIILLWDPLQLFQASFQLSFFVVLSIALFAPVLHELNMEYLEHDPFLPDQLIPWWSRKVEYFNRQVLSGFATSIAAWLGSLPLIAYYFNMVTPVSLLANLIVVPISGMALMCGLGSIISGAVSLPLAELFNHSAWFFMRCMMDVSGWMADLPGGWFYVPTPGPVGLLLYYSALIILGLGLWGTSALRWWLTPPLGFVAVLWLGHWTEEIRYPTLSILPLNGGHAILLENPQQNERLLVDCGRSESAESMLTPFLRSRGIGKLDGLILTHGDMGQMGGAQIIQTNFHIPSVFSSPMDYRSYAYRDLMREFRQQTNLVQEILSHDQVGPFTVLHPEVEDKFPRADDGAVVLKTTIAGTRILLLSELGHHGQNAP
jgi:ComEC/Rec2-related protein